MTRFNRTIILVLALSMLVALPALAADPAVSKRVLTDSDGMTVIVLTVSAKDQNVYGITVDDASASIEDVVAPNGWAAVTSGDKVSFRTVDSPIAAGKSQAFRIVTKNASGSLGVQFRDEKSMFGTKKSI